MTLGSSQIDSATQSWIRNASDDKAARAGCRFNQLAGLWVVFWIERYCRLYQGEGYAGQPVILRGCHECGDYELPSAIDLAEWNEVAEKVFLLRAERYVACVASGHACDWQFDCVMRIFGWQRWSERWSRMIRRFREAVIFVAKKNKKSPTAAALGLYLLCGDNEPGQQVMICAKDGQQSRKIIGEHAAQMLAQSPELNEECVLNRSTLRITHRNSKSWMEPLSSSNERTQKSKEGLNGSVLIDEVHVVDRDFIRRISRAGISRSEPLQIEVSTAGNDPDSYGRERFDYALQVERGEQDNQQLFAAIYAAPQNLSDAELDADPVRYGRAANPSMGHTVDPEEFLHDYVTSRRSIGTFLDFKMYRLNIWQRASNPWLKIADWEKCRREFSEDDLQGCICYSALDLSRTKDMSALVLVFPWSEDDQECYRILPYFWLPSQRVDEINSRVPQLASWVESGHIQITDGGDIDYGSIRVRYCELHKKFLIRELAYDQRFANETTQAISEGVIGKDGEVIQEGTGVDRIVFGQGDGDMAPATADFERLVIAGKIHHNGHPVLSWQAGHTHIIQRVTSQAKRAVKPSRLPNDPRTIDGIAAAIMGAARALIAKPPEKMSVETW